MAFTPLHDRVLVRRIESDEKTKGGLIIPDSAKEKPAEGEVVAVGAGAKDDNGARVAMDDFGAGHTSFRNLRRLPFDLIKMDGAFVQNLARSPDDRFFVRTLVDLAHHMNLPIVAEWVEDAETANLLTEWGVEYLQGVHFADARIIETGAADEAAAA